MVSIYTSFEAQQRLDPPFFRFDSAIRQRSWTRRRSGERGAARFTYVKALLEALCILEMRMRLVVPLAARPLLPPFRGVAARW